MGDKFLKAAIISCICLIGIFYLTLGISLTGNVAGAGSAGGNYTYTKALCSENNFCADYEITCNGDDFLGKKPISEYAYVPEEFQQGDRNDLINLCSSRS